MAIPYIPPGVSTVREVSTSPLLPTGTIQQIVGLVGEGVGYEVYTETISPVGTTPVTLTKNGIVLDSGDIVSVVKTTTNESVANTDYILTQTSPSSDAIEGDEVTTFERISYPAAPTLTGAAGALNGEYRYAVAWYYGTDGSGNPIESGVDEANVDTITLTDQSVNLSNIQTSSPPTTAVGTATGRVIYRSKNLGTSGNPNWGPWYQITTLSDLATATYADNNTDATVAANSRVSVGINSGDSLYVQYNFADVDYYEPTLFESLEDVFTKYGPAFDSTGNVNSKLSFGANLALKNGAVQIICTAVPSSPSSADYDVALEKLEDEQDVTIVVVLDGSVNTATSVAAHCTKSFANKKFRIGIVGRDGTATDVSQDTLRSNANAIAQEDVQMVSPPIVRYRNGFLNTDVDVGSQYAAAALAGMYATRSPEIPLTRKTVAGLIGLGEKRSENAMNVDASNGLTVLENRGGIIRVRHSISTNVSDINKREMSVTTAKYTMVKTVVDTVQESIIGTMVADELASLVIEDAIDDVLGRLVEDSVIRDYNGLRATPDPGDPTTYDLSWRFTPVYPVNNIAIKFSINLDTGSITGGPGLGGANNLIL